MLRNEVLIATCTDQNRGKLASPPVRPPSPRSHPTRPARAGVSAAAQRRPPAPPVRSAGGRGLRPAAAPDRPPLLLLCRPVHSFRLPGRPPAAARPPAARPPSIPSASPAGLPQQLARLQPGRRPFPPVGPHSVPSRASVSPAPFPPAAASAVPRRHWTDAPLPSSCSPPVSPASKLRPRDPRPTACSPFWLPRLRRRGTTAVLPGSLPASVGYWLPFAPPTPSAYAERDARRRRRSGGQVVSRNCPSTPPAQESLACCTCLPTAQLWTGRAHMDMNEEQPHVEDRCILWSDGMQLLEDAAERKHFLPTGLEGIDTLLGGGLRKGQLTEITGQSSSGKTQVCLHSAAHVAARHMGVVLYLDTSNSFSPSRIAHILDELPISLIKEPKDVRLKRVMSSIICESVFDIFALFEVLDQLEVSLNGKINDGGNKICLLIIDSVSSLLAPIIGGKNSQGRSMMISLAMILKKLAHKHKLSVLVTNHMVAGNGAPKPALGESWKAVPHIRLMISRDLGSSICTATTLKHTLLASGRRMKFQHLPS